MLAEIKKLEINLNRHSDDPPAGPAPARYRAGGQDLPFVPKTDSESRLRRIPLWRDKFRMTLIVAVIPEVNSGQTLTIRQLALHQHGTGLADRIGFKA